MTEEGYSVMDFIHDTAHTFCYTSQLEDAMMGSTGSRMCSSSSIIPLTPNDHCSGRTAPLTSKRCILYIYSTNIGTKYFKHGINSPFFFSSKCSLFHNSSIFGSCFIHIL